MVTESEVLALLGTVSPSQRTQVDQGIYAAEVRNIEEFVQKRSEQTGRIIMCTRKIPRARSPA